MQTVEQLEAKRAIAIAEVERLMQFEAQRIAAIAEVDRLTEAILACEKYDINDPFKNGTVLKVEMRYNSSNVTSTYAVVRAAGRYWLSGKLQRATSTITNIDLNEGRLYGWTWENFIVWLTTGDATVWRAIGLERVL